MANSYVQVADGLARAQRAAEKAIELDPTFADAYLMIGQVRMTVDHDWSGAAQYLAKARQLDQANPRALLMAAILARTVFDTLELARRLHPGQRNHLDALCKRYRVDNVRRDLHGALLDARILTDIYLAMTGGQGALRLHAEADGEQGTGTARRIGSAGRARLEVPVIRATSDELALHERMLDVLETAGKGKCLFRGVS